MTQELKGCPNPWCGKSKPTVMQGGFRGLTHLVRCATCYTDGPSRDDLNGGKFAAIAAWNTRTPDPALAARVEALEAGLREMVRLANMGFEDAMKEPEENGTYAAYNRARALLTPSVQGEG